MLHRDEAFSAQFASSDSLPGLREQLHGCAAEDIYNADEFDLQFWLSPNTLIADKLFRG